MKIVNQYILFLSLFFYTGLGFAQSLIHTYDDFNRLTSTEYSNGQVITYEYDLLGNRIGYEISQGRCLELQNLSYACGGSNVCSVAWTDLNPNTGDYYDRRSRIIGTSTWGYSSLVNATEGQTNYTYPFNNHPNCSTYEWQIRKYCAVLGTFSDWQTNIVETFCDELPDQVEISFTPNHWLRIAFPENVLSTSINSTTMRVSGIDNGRYQTGTYQINNNVVLFNPTGGFKAGEQLFVAIFGAENSAGQLFQKISWMGTTPVTNPTTATFVETPLGITLPSLATNHSYNFDQADFNKDGKMDILFRYHSSNGADTHILIYLQNSNGTFAAPTDYVHNNSYSGIRGTPDLNGDGYPDIVLHHNVPAQASVRLNNGDGTFGGASLYTVTNYSNGVDFADIDGDGDIDIIGKSGNSSLSVNRISILKNNGNGTFASQITISTGSTFGFTLQFADTDKDGDLDMFYTSSTSFSSAALLRIYENDGNGNFSLSSSQATGSRLGILSMEDMNGDGNIDMVTYPDYMGIIYGSGTLDFPYSSIVQLDAGYLNFLVADLNGDNHNDIFIADEYDGSTWLNAPYQTMLNNGTGNFTTTTGSVSLGERRATKMSDFDMDGDIDILFIKADRTMHLLENSGTSLATDAFTFQAVLEKQDVLLNWSKSIETHLSAYHIERSIDANHWIELGTVEAKGENSYQFIDKDINREVRSAGLVYYRLKLIHKDETIEYSPIEVIKLDIPEQLFQLFPNPTSGMVNLQYFGFSGENAIQINLLGIDGKLIQSQDFQSETGMNEYLLDLSQLPAGIYYVQLVSGEDVFSKKLVKQ